MIIMIFLLLIFHQKELFGKVKKLNLYKGGKPDKAQEMYTILKIYTEEIEIRAKYI